MLSLLRNHPGYTLASAFKLRPSVLHVATRHFLTTSSNRSLAQKAGKEASSKTSTVQKSNGKSDAKSKKNSADSKQEKPPAKPKRITKKDLTPPSKRPMSSFAAFALEYRAKHPQNTDTPTPYRLADTLRDASAAWVNLSGEEKQTYAPSREALEAHKLAVKDWQAGLSAEAKRALKLRRRRAKGTGHALFISETYDQAVGDNFGEKISDRAAVWNSLSSEEKEAYAKRAAETSFGVRAKREEQHDKQVKREAKKKAEAEEKKAKEKAQKQKEHAEQAKEREKKKAEALEAKRDKNKVGGEK